MGKGKRAHSISTISFPRNILENGLLVASQVPLPALLNTTPTIAKSTNLESTKIGHRYRWKSSPKRLYKDFEQKLEAAPLYVLVSTYLNYFVLILFGHLRDFVGKHFKPDQYVHLKTSKGYAPLVSDFDSFYTRRMYLRIRDCWNRPITGVAGRQVNLLERTSQNFNKTFKLTGKCSEQLNFASYNYLGFAQNTGPCADEVEYAVNDYGITSASSRSEAGTIDIHDKMEKVVAEFVGKEAAMIVSMGFATNSTTIPTLVSKGCLIISDELNHSSIIFGARLSGAAVRTFKHNDMFDLRNLLKEVISQGQPRTHRSWKKILVIVEGLYSMEGTIVNLPGLIQLKSEYKFYLYVDEAHSIGALGDCGGGVCDFFGIDPAKVDILMGTFTKSFGSAGGYIAADKSVIDHLKLNNHAYVYAEPVSVPVAQQVITSMSIISGQDGTGEGTRRINQLSKNSAYLSKQLRQMGFIIYGDHGSPVIPLLLFHPAKIPAFSRELLKRGIAVVVVGYPATPIISSRARLCVSASHTKNDLDYALKCISEVGDLLMLKVSQQKLNSKM